MTGGDDKTARVWDVSTLRPIRRATGDGAVIGDGGRVTALANKRGATSIVDASTGATKAQFKRPAVDDIESLHVDDHGRTLAINPVIDDNTAIWSVSNKQRIVALEGATLAVSHDGGHALVDRYGRGTMVDTRDVKASKTVKWDEQPVTAIFSPNDRAVVTLVGTSRRPPARDRRACGTPALAGC